MFPIADQGKRLEFLKGDGISCFPVFRGEGTQMILAEKRKGAHYHQFLFANQLLFQEGIRRCIQPQHQIQLLGFHQLDMLDCIPQGDGNVDLWISPVECFQKTGQQETGPGGTDPQADLPDFSRLDFLDPMAQAFFQVLDLPEGADHGFS